MQREERLAGLSQGSDSLPEQPYWGYEDIAIFFALAALVNTAVRLGARLHVIAQSEITNPGIRLQFIIVLILSLGLYLALKLRYRRPVVRALDWTAPSMRYTIIALAAGILSAAGVALYLRARHQTLSLCANMILLGSVLAPILEESLFQGFLLPVLARTAGDVWT
jgi:membrane protease YdiL (CAAX protease family)